MSLSGSGAAQGEPQGSSIMCDDDDHGAREFPWGGLPSGQGGLTTRTKSRQDASDGNYSGDVEGMFSRGIGDKPFGSQVKLASGFGASG